MNIWKAIESSKIAVGNVSASGFGVFCITILLAVALFADLYFG